MLKTLKTLHNFKILKTAKTLDMIKTHGTP